MKLAETSVIYDSLNPEWEETKNLLACYNGEYIKVCVKDSDTFNRDDYIGSCKISCLTLRDNPFKEFTNTFELKVDEDDEGKTRGRITLTFKYSPFNSVESTTIDRSIATYFPARKNNKVQTCTTVKLTETHKERMKLRFAVEETRRKKTPVHLQNATKHIFIRQS